MQGLLATCFTYLVTALGASLVLFFKRVQKKPLDIMMGFAAGVMIAASFWSLLSPAIELAEELGHRSYLTAAIGFCSGGLFIILSDLLLSGLSVLEGRNKRYKKPLLLVGAMTLHNIPEGLAIGVAFGSAALGIEGTSVTAAAMLAFGIGVQNLPEGLCAAVPMREAGMGRFKSFAVGQSSALVEPIAGVIGVLAAMTVRSILPYALTFSAGAMIAVVCSELIPESFSDNKILASLGVLAGFSVMMMLDVALG
jgi:ZIP family zinc transporter